MRRHLKLLCAFKLLVLAISLVIQGPFTPEPARGSIPRRAAAVARNASLFLSPNTDDGLSLDEASRRLQSRQQRHLAQLARDILAGLGAKDVRVLDSLGDWSAGVENSMLIEIPDTIGPPTLRYAAARLGLIARQQSVL